ncbi:hypothetical protein GQ44DRAFT_733136 [Phaeosphaeriaceae sp. PMI808]|nr:hypothetical protein GQ44DRAFT_733136 [Phaeosphaeriaceae sp. PMI808]
MASKMSSLMDLVSQNQPHFKTHQALLVIGMQNDFIQPDGRLPVSSKNGYLDRIQTLIPKFRELNGNVIWVQTLYEGDRIANDANTGEGDALVVGGLIDGDESSTEGGDEDALKDLPVEKSKSSKHKQRALDLLKRVSARRKTIPREVARATAEQDDELFLLKSERKVPACVPDTHGAQFADIIAMQFELPADIVIRTTNYSAFQGTSLLMTLRAKLVTELYICGCITNVSVLATVIDAARHGVKINVIEDCLGYRKQVRHELALKRMDEFFDAYLVSSTEILTRQRPAVEEHKLVSPSGSKKGSKSTEKPLESMVGQLSLNEADARPMSRSQSIRSPTKILTGGQRKLSLVSVAESRKTLNSTSAVEHTVEVTDEQFADNLVRGVVIPDVEVRAQDSEKQETNLVTKKIRMRTKGKKKKKKKPETESLQEEAGAEAYSAKAEAVQLVTIASSAAEGAKSPLGQATETRRSSMLSKAESVLNLREKMSKQQPLKTVASQPVLSGKAEPKEKERDRDSWSDRMRLSLSRTPKLDSTFESKNRLSIVSMKTPSTPSKIGSRPASIAATITEVSTTPSRAIEREAEEPCIIATEKSAELKSPLKATVSAPHFENTITGKPPKLQSLKSLPVVGPDDDFGEGDSRIVYDFFPPDLKHVTDPSKPLRDVIFTQLYNEVRWQKMLHRQGEVPRLVCCQGEFSEDGSMPVYRHPTDQALPLLHFSPKVQVIRNQAEKLVGHPLNHVLIQLYRSGNDYISEHSDKTLDIARGSSIVNVSFGAQRTMRLRTKKVAEDKDGGDKQRETQRVAMPHNSMLVLGLKSNEKWLHGIMADKRPTTERSDAETAYNGIRISLTFRHIVTFLDARESMIWGQGATAKDKKDAADVTNGDEVECERMIRAFSRENYASEFDWELHYGGGFDLLHLQATPTDIPLLFASNNAIETGQAQLGLWEAKIAYTVIDAPALEKQYEVDRQVALRDTDIQHTEVLMSSSILLYIDRYLLIDRDERGKACTANAYPVILLAARILKAWYNHSVPTYKDELTKLLACLEDKLTTEKGPFIAGRRFSVADCYVWPIIDEITGWSEWDVVLYPSLADYYRMTWKKKACVKKLREKLPEVKKSEEDVEDKA